MTKSSIVPAAMAVEDAAHYIGISRAGLFRLFRAGKLHPVKVAGRTLVRRIDADALLERSVVAHRSDAPGRSGLK